MKIIEFFKNLYVEFILIKDKFIGFLARVLFGKEVLVFLDTKVVKFDNRFANWIISKRTPLRTKVMIFFTYFGEQLLPVFCIILSIILYLNDLKREAILLPFITVFGGLLVAILKRVVLRPRPKNSPLIQLKTLSFPSGHAAASMIFYMLCHYLVTITVHNFQIEIISFITFLTLVFLIGLTRIYIGVHYLSDVLAGYFVAIIYLIIVYVVVL